jgi:hypothetical protein
MITSLFKPFSEKAFDLFSPISTTIQDSPNKAKEHLFLFIRNGWRLISFIYFIIFTTVLGLSAFFFFYLPFSRTLDLLLKIK